MTTTTLFPNHATAIIPVNGKDILSHLDEATAPSPDDTDTSLPLTGLPTTGYEKAEQHRGNALALDNLLNQVLRSFLVEKRSDEARQKKHDQQIDTQILTLEKEAETARTEIRKINGTELPALRNTIDQLDEEILQIRKDETAGLRHPDHRDRFRLWLYTGLCGMLTVFVYLFYVSAFFSAFSRDVTAEALAAGDNAMGVISNIFVKAAFTTSGFHWIGPFLLFAFGGLLHSFWEQPGPGRWAKVGLMALVVGITDGLLAYFVEKKIFKAEEMMGQADAAQHHWWGESIFYLVLMMGFVAGLVWSGLLHTVMHEIGKKDVARLVALDIQHRRDKQAALREQINTLTLRLEELEGTITQTELARRALENDRQMLLFSASELEKYVTEFYDGWLTYVNNRMRNEVGLRDACDAVLKAFYARHLA